MQILGNKQTKNKKKNNFTKANIKTTKINHN